MVNIFSMRMFDNLLPADCHSHVPLIYTDTWLESMYKVFTDGFDTTKQFGNPVYDAEKNTTTGTIQNPEHFSNGCLLTINGVTARVLYYTYTHITLEGNVPAGAVHVNGLGFEAVSLDKPNKRFTVKDRRHGNAIMWDFSNMRTANTQTQAKFNAEYIKISIDGGNKWYGIYSNSSALSQTNMTADWLNKSHKCAFKSFASDGNWVYFNTVFVPTAFTPQYQSNAYYWGMYGFGFIDSDRLLLPDNTDNSSDNVVWQTAGLRFDYWQQSNNYPKERFVTLNKAGVLKKYVEFKESLGGGTSSGGLLNSNASYYATEDIIGGGTYVVSIAESIQMCLPGVARQSAYLSRCDDTLYKFEQGYYWSSDSIGYNESRYISLQDIDWGVTDSTQSEPAQGMIENYPSMPNMPPRKYVRWFDFRRNYQQQLGNGLGNYYYSFEIRPDFLHVVNKNQRSWYRSYGANFYTFSPGVLNDYPMIAFLMRYNHASDAPPRLNSNISMDSPEQGVWKWYRFSFLGQTNSFDTGYLELSIKPDPSGIDIIGYAIYQDADDPAFKASQFQYNKPAKYIPYPSTPTSGYATGNKAGAYGRIYGKITVKGQPYSGLTVEITRMSYEYMTFYTNTDAEGKYEFKWPDSNITDRFALRFIDPNYSFNDGIRANVPLERITP